MNYFEVFTILIPDLALIALGFCLFRIFGFQRSMWESFERLTYYVLFPVLLFEITSRGQFHWVSMRIPLLAACCVLVFGFICALICRWFSAEDYWRSGAQIGFRFNTYVAITLGSRILDTQGMSFLAIIIAVAVPACNAVAVYWMSGKQGVALFIEMLKNPLLTACCLGLLANALNFSIPQTLQPDVTRITHAAITLGLMSVGAGLRWEGLHDAKRLGFALLCIKHLLMPAFAIWIALVFTLTTSQFLALVLFAALPTASSAYVLTVRLGGRSNYVAGLITVSTLLSVISLPYFLSHAYHFSLT